MWHDIFDYSWIDMREPDMSFASIPMFIRVHPREEKSGILNIVRRPPVPPSQCWAAGPIPTNQRNTHTYETLQHWNGGYRGSVHNSYDDATVIELHVHRVKLWISKSGFTGGCILNLYDDDTVIDLHVQQVRLWISKSGATGFAISVYMMMLR